MLYDVPVNQQLVIKKEEAKILQGTPFSAEKKVKPFHLEKVNTSAFRHKSSGLIDFNRDRLLPMMYSNETPTIAVGDIDSDGVKEFYVGGGKDQSGVFLKMGTNGFSSSSSKALDKYNIAEETKGSLFDVDNDGDLDLYMATGGRFFPKSSSALMDRIFLNNGKGEYTESAFELPFNDFFSTSVAEPIDFDRDGDFDLLVGERFEPFTYGLGGRGYLLQNDGKGLFKDVTSEFAPALLNIGMITDAAVCDFNNDGWSDLVVVGDWMPIVMLKNDGKHFTNISTEIGLKETEGWWHSIEASDLNKDGKVDFILANHGRNTFFKTGDRMYVNDFDRNGSVEQIFCTKVNGKYFPILDKDEFLSQLPSMKKTLLYYKDYAKKSIDELFPSSILENSKIYQVNLLSSVALLSNPTGYKIVELPLEAQYSPIYSISIADFDKDGVQDVMAGGNQYQVKPQFGRYDASNGWFFKGVLNKGQFALEGGQDLGIKGQIRDIEFIEVGKTKYILFAKHDDDLEIYKVPD